MKTKVFWTGDEEAAVFAEAKRLRQADPAATIKDLAVQAQLVLPAALRKSAKTVGLRMQISALIGRRAAQSSVSSLQSPVSPHPLPTSQATASPAPVAPGRALLPGKRKYTPRRSARPGAIPPSARTAAPAVDRESAPNDFLPPLTIEEAADLFIDTMISRFETRFAARLAVAGRPVECGPAVADTALGGVGQKHPNIEHQNVELVTSKVYPAPSGAGGSKPNVQSPRGTRDSCRSSTVQRSNVQSSAASPSVPRANVGLKSMTDDELKSAIVAAQKDGDRLTIIRCTGELRRRDLAANAIERGLNIGGDE